MILVKSAIIGHLLLYHLLIINNPFFETKSMVEEKPFISKTTVGVSLKKMYFRDLMIIIHPKFHFIRPLINEKSAYKNSIYPILCIMKIPKNPKLVPSFNFHLKN